MLFLVDFQNHEFIFCKWSENLVEAKIRILLESGLPKKYLKVFYDESHDPDSKEHNFIDDFLDVDTFREVCEWNLDFDEDTISFLVDMDKRRKNPLCVPFVVNSWEDFHKKYPIDRDDMDLVTEKEYLEDAYKLYEAEGFASVFSIDDPYFMKEFADCIGKPFEVIGRCIDSEEFEIWEDFLPAWTIRLSNGETFEAWAGVICPGYPAHLF